MLTRLNRIHLIARHSPRRAIELYKNLEQKAIRQHHAVIRLAALYQRYFILERLGEAASLMDELSLGLQSAEKNNLPQAAGQMLEALGRLCYTAGAYRDAIHYWTHCIDICSLIETQKSGIEARIGLGQIYDALGDHVNAARFQRDASHLLAASDDLYLIAKVALNLGANQTQIGQTDQAIAQFKKALEASKKGGIREFEAESYWHLGLAALIQGDIERAEELTLDALQVAEACGKTWALAAAMDTLAQIQRCQNKLELSFQTYLKALELAVRIDSVPRQASCYSVLSELAEQRGDIRAALDFLRQGVILNEQLSMQMNAPDRFRILQQYDLSEKSKIELLLDLVSVQGRRDENLQQFFSHLSVAGCQILAIQYLSIWLADPVSGELRCVALQVPDSTRMPVQVGTALPRAMRSVYQRLAEAEYYEMVVQDIRLHPDIAEFLPFLKANDIRSFIEMPLRLHDKNIGLIFYGQTNKARNWNREDVLFGRHIASLMEQTLHKMEHQQIQLKLHQHNEELELRVEERTRELRNANQALEQLSLTDSLTGLRNRHFLTQQIETDVALLQRHSQLELATRELAEIQETSHDLIFFMLDLDHFKAVNDQYGHASGDLVLVQLAYRLREVFRDSDHLVRWGGEEFLIVARNLPRSNAAMMAERLRSAVADRPFQLADNSNLHKTCSIGYACMPFLLHEPLLFNWLQVVEVADQALYQAKRSGRNTWIGLSGHAFTKTDGLHEKVQKNLVELIMSGDLVASMPQKKNH